MSAPRFSPPPSEADDRATSPALSSSSRTTTSIPTDVSDISSLDGDDDYEVIDAPVPVHADSTETASHAGASFLFNSQHGATIASEIDGSSFLAPHPYQYDEEHDGYAWRGDGHGSSLRASTSLATLSLEPDVLDSQASSQLRFPDPLDESFQEDGPGRQSSRGVQCSDTENDQLEFNIGANQPNQMSTPRIKQTSGPFAAQVNAPVKQTSSKGTGSTPSPIGIPFNWDKKMIMVNVARAIMGLIVIILSTGVLPSWPGSSTVSKEAGKVCQGHPSSLLDSVLGHTSACSTAMTPSKALIVPPRNSSGVLSSMTSLMTRPTSKVIRPSSRSKELMRRPRRDCNALSLYVTEIRLPSIPTSLDYVDKAAVCQSVRKISRRKGKAAKKSAQIITASAQRKWHDYVQELSEWLHQTTFAIAETVRQHSLAIKQRTAKDDPWGAAWKMMYRLMAFVQQSWVEWMRDVHETFLRFWAIIQKESTSFKQDAEAGFQSAREAADRQYKQAAVTAKRVQKSFVKDLRLAQKGMTRVWQEASESVPVQRFHKDMSAAKKQVSETVKAKKEALRMAAVNMKQAQIKRAARKRLIEIQQLRAKHRELMRLVRKQGKVKHRASRLINKGKVAVYRKAIQSVQARHQVENMLGKMTSSGKKNLQNKRTKGKKTRQKKAASEARSRA